MRRLSATRKILLDNTVESKVRESQGDRRPYRRSQPYWYGFLRRNCTCLSLLCWGCFCRGALPVSATRIKTSRAIDMGSAPTARWTVRRKCSNCKLWAWSTIGETEHFSDFLHIIMIYETDVAVQLKIEVHPHSYASTGDCVTIWLSDDNHWQRKWDPTPSVFFWNERKAAGRITLKFCIPHGALFAQILKGYVEWRVVSVHRAMTS